MIVCRRFQPLPSIDKPPYMAMPIIPLPPPFFNYFSDSSVFGKIFWQYRANEIPDKQKIKLMR